MGSAVAEKKLWGWFRTECQQALAKAIDRVQPRRVAELGSWLGESSIWMAKRIPSQSVLYCVDTWEGSKEHRDDPNLRDLLPALFDRFSENIREHGVEHKVRANRMTTREAAEWFRKADITFDLVYVDASHEFQDVLDDLVDYGGLVTSEGVLCGDDYDWESVRSAVQRYAQDNGLGVCSRGPYWELFRFRG